ncbi:MAG: pyruvate dehydrogenase complex dihydrolipoamide acetyltransferase [Verrucomicrobia bacterium]|nr:pyruvate dehydrogenase complex dihydrolipoamide acetyltransferase [Verrucomicrobiota bacterium]
MPFTVHMPKLSPTMEEGVISKWLKAPGDHVEAGDVLLEIATDKATVEHAALDEGWLRQILVQNGDKAAVNAPLAIFTAAKDESIENYTPETIAGAAAAPAKEVAAPKAAAAPKKALKAEMPVATTAPKAAVIPEKPKESARVLASPLAKKLAEQQGLDLTSVKGSGPHGRVMSRDLDKATTQTAAPTRSSAQKITEKSLTPMRRVIAQRLQESKQLIPHFYVRQEVDAQAIVAMREECKKLDLPYTVNDFIVKACAHALEKHPDVNCGFNEESQTIAHFSRVDISLAVTIPGGLITPIITDAANKTLAQLSKEIKVLAGKAREGKLQPEEYQGGSFTVSNLGMYGITEMTAIINPPQGAILGIGAVSDEAVVKNGAIVPGKRMVLTLSCDHRIIDGSEAAQFMRTLKQLIEHPLLLSVDR